LSVGSGGLSLGGGGLLLSGGFGGSLGSSFGTVEKLLLPLGQGLCVGASGGVVATLARVTLLDALSDGVGDHTGEQTHRANRVVVARDAVRHVVWVAVRVKDADHRDAKLARLVNGEVLLVGVNNP